MATVKRNREDEDQPTETVVEVKFKHPFLKDAIDVMILMLLFIRDTLNYF